MIEPSQIFPRFLTLRDLAARDGITINETATEAERGAIAAAYALQAVAEFRIQARVSRVGRDGWKLEGAVIASLTQTCVVTLAPVDAEIDEPFSRAFQPGAVKAEADVLVDPAADDPAEPLGDGVDLGAVALETLALGLEPYPRAPGVEFEARIAAPPGVEPLTDEAIRPFAGLAALKSRLKS